MRMGKDLVAVGEIQIEVARLIEWEMAFAIEIGLRAAWVQSTKITAYNQLMSLRVDVMVI
jgi:hypothetical protein